ncbi:hypothetical protein GCM10007352_02920 [Mucilaginibacter phyllosphaerae]|nr:hypothetical protein GCM10007352_02920 [Mucilaginibacter phyllosphaerae]
MWLVYFLFLIVSTISVSNNLKVFTETNITMRAAGAFGLIRHYYIEPYQNSPHKTKNDQVTDRVYSGLSLARLLVPKSDINSYKKVTFYALQRNDQRVHFAATSDSEPATTIRLYIDILAYLINKYLFIHVGFFLLWAFNSTIYSYLKKGKDVNGEIAEADNSKGLENVQKTLLYITLILLFV